LLIDDSAPSKTVSSYLSRMKTIVLFGAGKSSAALINYLAYLANDNFCRVIITDNNLQNILSKIENQSPVQAFQLNIENEIERHNLIQKADIVISLMPPQLHYLLALDCIYFNKHLLTASYVSEDLKKLEQKIKSKNLLFLCEMGLDPGIDHMSAMQIIHRIKNEGGKITSFKSHCGGLVAPENDDNPWHYKISWNPRNVVMAGKSGAIYKENGTEINKIYAQLFTNNSVINVPSLREYAYYPNRDSLTYVELYELQTAETFLRTTLRHPEFCFGWKNIIDLKLTDEEKIYETNELSIAAFFRQHFIKHGLQDWLATMMMQRLSNKEQLSFLGIDDEETKINKGLCSAADVLQFILEKKLALQPDDKDMIVMMHEIEYIIGNKNSKVTSTLIVKGENNVHTAMAKTVGLPLGIAAKLILQEKITETGLHIPVSASVYEPVLKELKNHGITFVETIN
jgi:saccharopine dehydrogenase-like NADP-dependent oxidoreductase